MMELQNENDEYINETDGLLYCGKCHTPRQFRCDSEISKGKIFYCLCECRSIQLAVETAAREKYEEMEKIRRLKANGIQDKLLLELTFENDDGSNSQMQKARTYVDKWLEAFAKNIGLLLWGDAGTGKSYFAACIANALLEQGVPVLMTSFSKILNALSGMYAADRNSFISSLDRYMLLIIDDFGMERDTEYALEQVYSIIDARCKSGRPLIVTTNLTLVELKNSSDISHSRIYSRILEMCTPIQFTGEDMRKIKASEKMGQAITLFK